MSGGQNRHQGARLLAGCALIFAQIGQVDMKIRNSLRSLARRDRNNRVVRRRGRLYVINKVRKRFKARQG